MTYARRRDSNHTHVVRVLEDAGATVHGVSPTTSYENGVPDLVVGYRGVNFWLEVKTEKGALSPGQEKWHRWWKGKPVAVVRSPVEALRAIGAL